ncbi:unnamed protein product [Debaryomyces tyrocola]|nr:unnamed protein product [Debaryomyces tyrocola]
MNKRYPELNTYPKTHQNTEYINCISIL